MMVCERAGEVLLVGVLMYRGHCAVRMGEERIGRGGWRLPVGSRTKGRMSAPWRLIMDLGRMGGELVGNARRLLRIIHGIGGESRHSERKKGGTRRRRV